MTGVVARCNGTEIVDRGDEAWLVFKELPSPVWPMVAALLACVTLVNGTVQGIYAFARNGGKEHLLIAVVLLGVGFAFVRVGIGLRRAAREAEEKPGRPFLIFADGMLLDAERRELAPLAAAQLGYVFQLTSSSKALQLTWPSGTQVIARGNPFGDSVDDVISALQALGLRGP